MDRLRTPRRGCGATITDEGVHFSVRAPRATTVAARTEGGDHPFRYTHHGAFEATIASDTAGSDYQFLLDGERLLPDPASCFQPHGVHDVSRIVDPTGFVWTDVDWKGVAMADYVIFELHVGTCTPADETARTVPALINDGCTISPAADSAVLLAPERA